MASWNELAARTSDQPGGCAGRDNRWAGAGGRTTGNPRRLLLAALALLLAALVVAIAGGAFRPPADLPSGRNGAIVYAVGDISGPPYDHVHLVNADGRGDREIAQGSCPVFSRDGQLAYMSGWWRDKTAQLQVTAADGSSPRVVPEIGDFGIRPLARWLAGRMAQGWRRCEPRDLAHPGPRAARQLVSLPPPATRTRPIRPRSGRRITRSHLRPTSQSGAEATSETIQPPSPWSTRTGPDFVASRPTPGTDQVGISCCRQPTHRLHRTPGTRAAPVARANLRSAGQLLSGSRHLRDRHRRHR